MSTDVLIYVADGMLTRELDYASRIEEQLHAAGLSSTRCDLTALHGVQVPPPARAYLFTGGETSARSDMAWMRSAVDTARLLLAHADRVDFAVIGICLGSQILAEALRPGSVMACPAIEVGLATVARPAQPALRQVVPAFHYQAISSEVRTVPGIRIEWGNAHTPVQAFSYGQRVFACQFHPELSATDLRSLIDHQQGTISRWGGDPAAAHRSVDRFAAAVPKDLFRRTVTGRILDAPAREARLFPDAPLGFRAFKSLANRSASPHQGQ